MQAFQQIAGLYAYLRLRGGGREQGIELAPCLRGLLQLDLGLGEVQAQARVGAPRGADLEVSVRCCGGAAPGVGLGGGAG